MGGTRRLLRLLRNAALVVTLAVATSQILTDDGVDLRWLYVSLAVAVLTGVYEVLSGRLPAAPDGDGPFPRLRRLYLRQLRAGVRDMETVGIATQSEFVLRMEQVYVDVSLVPKPGHDTGREPYVGAVPGSPGERRTLASFLADGRSTVLAVIGGPGTGKTTLARNTALTLCLPDWRFWRRRPLPVLLYLRDHAATVLREDPPGLAEVATTAGWLEGRIPASWVEQRLDRGGCVVLLDGLDEVADAKDRRRVVTWVRRQIERHPDNRYVLTSRPHGYLANPVPNAEVLQVRRFTGEQISRFLHGWSAAIEERATGSTGPQVRGAAAAKADDLLDRLRRRPALYDLAANPLLLTMIANVHRYRGQLPGSRADLYAEMCDVLLHRRSETRNLPDATGLRGPQKERVARALALAMMHSGYRDVTAEEAHRAVRQTLRQVSRDVTPQVFLEEARKSGLLVEREHGVFSFAHLTLQEYLAAAQLGPDSRLPAQRVDDPWWRETTLLWAANADATPVITACLASGTVRALALAFDCADEAAEVEPGVRQQLDDLLASGDGAEDADEGRERLLDGIAAARTLREVVTLGEVALCAHPVPRHLYERFARAERRAGLHTPGPSGEAPPDAPATGVWADDARRFAAWVDALLGDEATYRLPTPEELQDPAAGLVADRERHHVWAGTRMGPRLYRPGGDRRPHLLSRARLHEYLRSDRARATTYLRLALAEHAEVGLALRLSRAFSAAIGRAPDFGGAPEGLAAELALTLGLHRELDCIRDVERILEQMGGIRRSVVWELDVIRDRSLLRAHFLSEAMGLDSGLDSALERSRVRNLMNGRALALARQLSPTNGIGPGITVDGPPSTGRTLIDVLELLPTDRTALPVGGPALTLGIGLTRLRGLAGDLGLGDGPGRSMTGVTVQDTLDLAVELAAAAGSPGDAGGHATAAMDGLRLRLAVPAFRSLLAVWRPAREPATKRGEALKAFDAHLVNLPDTYAPVPGDENPAVALWHAGEALSRRPRAADIPRPREARLLLAQAQELVGPILTRELPYDPATLSTARLGALAATALLREVGLGHEAAAVARVLYSLVAFSARENAPASRDDEVILLVRA
ncbi:NACHT domain-containing NTPase [Streptomyces sp. JJ36]|uniref:NACHT domain-containing protein n=1 Tax=Streptomyces sp. JJ36 TaxID=2736645 RepID=UPI001F3227B8|nr:NACHT domain-containing protein [Streptomyces sp. JJ36]MCF6525282.1 NACHT domain-containing protein [Streptomyces sp. JJ36]